MHYQLSCGEVKFNILIHNLIYSSGPLASYLCNRYSHRRVGQLGGVLSCLGTAVAAYAPNLPVVYISLGVIAGKK